MGRIHKNRRKEDVVRIAMVLYRENRTLFWCLASQLECKLTDMPRETLLGYLLNWTASCEESAFNWFD